MLPLRLYSVEVDLVELLQGKDTRRRRKHISGVV
jgi:hypothetical protein